MVVSRPPHAYYAGNIPRTILESPAPRIVLSGLAIISTDTSFVPTGTSAVSKLLVLSGPGPLWGEKKRRGQVLSRVLRDDR